MAGQDAGRGDDDQGDGAQGETVDKATGEVLPASDKPAQGAGQGASEPPAVLTFADVSNKFQQAVKANDVDLLDAHATLIHAVEDAEQRNALTQEYEQIRAELVAAADKKPARK